MLSPRSTRRPDPTIFPLTLIETGDCFEQDRVSRDASTTDRESAIMFGLPATLIEGVFVGRKIEKERGR